MFSISLYVGIAMSRDSPAATLFSSRLEHVEERAAAERAGRPESGVVELGHRLGGIGSAHQAERLAAREKSAEGHASGAAGLDERKRCHLGVSGLALDERDLPRAIEHRRRQLPRLEELSERARLVGRPDPAREVGILLDQSSEVSGLIRAVEEVGGLAVGSGPAAEAEAVRAKAEDALEMRLAMGLAPCPIVGSRADGDVRYDHRWNDAPAWGGITE